MRKCLYIGGMRDRRIFKDLLGLMMFAEMSEQSMKFEPEMNWPIKPPQFTSSASTGPSSEKRKALRKKRKKRKRK